MRRIPFLGVYPGLDIDGAARCGNVVVLDAVTLLHSAGIIDALHRHPHLRILLQIHILPQVWLAEADWEWDQLGHIREDLRGQGLLDRVLAIVVDEECMTGAYAGDRFAWVGGDARAADPYVRIDWCHGRWREAVRRVRAAFPLVPIGVMETLWHNARTVTVDGRTYGAELYRPVIPEADFLGIDAYIHGPLTPRAFYDQVWRVLDHAGTLGKALVVVAQAFSDAGGRVLPTVDQLGWWAMAAPASTAALLLFCLDVAPIHAAAGVRGFAASPAHVRAIEQYAYEQGYVPG